MWVASTDSLKINPELITIENINLDIKNIEIKLIRKSYWNILEYIGDFKLEYESLDDKFSPVKLKNNINYYYFFRWINL